MHLADGIATIYAHEAEPAKRTRPRRTRRASSRPRGRCWSSIAASRASSAPGGRRPRTADRVMSEMTCCCPAAAAAACRGRHSPPPSTRSLRSRCVAPRRQAASAATAASEECTTLGERPRHAEAALELRALISEVGTRAARERQGAHGAQDCTCPASSQWWARSSSRGQRRCGWACPATPSAGAVDPSTCPTSR